MHFLLSLIVTLNLFLHPATVNAQASQQSDLIGMDVRAIWILDSYLGESKYGAYANAIAQTKVKYVRFLLPWAVIQPTATGPIDWTRTDKFIAALKAAGLEPVVVLRQAPPWASVTGICDEATDTINENCLPIVVDYKNFVSAAVSRYGYGAGGKKEVRYWEILNEPDYGSITPVQYAPIIQAVYPVIKKIDPQAQVLLTGLSQADVNPLGMVAGRIWLGQLLSIAGVANSFDIVSIHGFNNPTYLPPIIKRFRTVLTSYGINKPVWLTEFDTGSGLYKLNCPAAEQGDDVFYNQFPALFSSVLKNTDVSSNADKVFYQEIGCSIQGPGVVDTHSMPGNTPLVIRPKTLAALQAAIKPFLPTPTPAPTPVAILGDLNHDGKVDSKDFNIFRIDFGKTGTPGFVSSDINKDGKVDMFDYNILDANFGK